MPRSEIYTLSLHDALPISFVQRVTASDPVKNVLSGTWLGHQLHPVLTDLPIGAWTMATALDLTGGRRADAAARRLVGLGVRSEEHTSELQSPDHVVCRLLL